MHFRWSQEQVGHVGIRLRLSSIIAAIVPYGRKRFCAGLIKSRTASCQMLSMSNGIAVES